MFDDNDDDLQFLMQVEIPETNGKGKEPLRSTPPRHAASPSLGADHLMDEPAREVKAEVEVKDTDLVPLPAEVAVKTETDPVALMNSLSVADVPEQEEKPKIRLNAPVPTVKKTSKRVGEDVFTEASVKEWQLPRIKAWEGRHIVSFISLWMTIICQLIICL